ncbi:hypothetical protein [Sporosarcina ureae]|uniref:Uncharacterized protein n=1 Tax=Sporosarcina ureae TaxID=1571 RepID=A0ABM6JSU4_SPOUR|nr:hypothetical protein [Sporosarcina ureae]ARF13068.1 hypothetical protein SporoS204_02075 [Sporosarcina ureae]
MKKLCSVTEKDRYDEGEDVKKYTKLEYIGEEDEVKITHGSLLFLFAMTETTRNYVIEGIKKRLMYMGEECIDKYYMSRLIEQAVKYTR